MAGECLMGVSEASSVFLDDHSPIPRRPARFIERMGPDVIVTCQCAYEIPPEERGHLREVRTRGLPSWLGVTAICDPRAISTDVVGE
jgi:hypothetical protein